MKKSTGFGVLLILGILMALALPQSFGKTDAGVKVVSKSAEAKTATDANDLNISDVHLNFEGKELNLALPIYYQNNRYYLPLTELVSKLNGKSEIMESTLLIEMDGVSIVLDANNKLFIKDGSAHKLKKRPVMMENDIYVSMFDFSRMFDLKTDWNVEDKVISLYWRHDKLTPKEVPPSDKVALIRLEDVAASPYYSKPENLEKLRIIADYLYSENVPFSVAWVPRYVDPTASPPVDVDLSTQYSMTNADWVYTLDYLIDRNGTIGLHGYTHQYGKARSVTGAEFHTDSGEGTRIPSGDQYVQVRVNASIEAARKLDIPYGFFEAPHYAISGNQLKVVERNFDVIYQFYPGAPDKVVEKKRRNRVTKYVPTTLSYVRGKDIEAMIGKIDGLKPGVLGSFYYHPFLEFNDIIIMKEPDGYPSYSYSETSGLHQLVRAFYERGYKFSSIDEVK